MPNRLLFYNSGEFRQQGYAYRYNTEDEIFICLFDAQNKWVNVKWQMANGSEVSPEMAMGRTPTTHNASHGLKDVQNKVSSCFSQSEKMLLKAEKTKLIIDLRINPQSGKIDDVIFRFRKSSKYAGIPVQTYRNIESSLKNSLSFNVTNEGKKLNYVMVLWDQFIK